LQRIIQVNEILVCVWYQTGAQVITNDLQASTALATTNANNSISLEFYEPKRIIIDQL